MHSTARGDKLEDALYDYLVAEQNEGKFVYGVYAPELCKIRKKPKYPCTDRQTDVEFDVVIEVCRPGSDKPFTYVVFECKNYQKGVPATRVTDFSYYLGNVFGHSVKAVFVVTSRLQQGAEDIARSRKISIVKFIDNGVHILADRAERYGLESAFVKPHILAAERRPKSLKFSAFTDGRYFSDPAHLVHALIGEDDGRNKPVRTLPVSYMSAEDIKAFADEVLEGIGYAAGPVDITSLCELISIEVSMHPIAVLDENGALILGSADFYHNRIEINPHGNPYRERFTIAHEVGHFCLGHGLHLHAETVVEQDLLSDARASDGGGYARMEWQANLFASELMLPERVFKLAAALACNQLGMRSNIGHHLAFVDDQAVNFMPYNDLLSTLSDYFQVSKQAIEIKLKKLDLIDDRRAFGEATRAKRIGDLFPAK